MDALRDLVAVVAPKVVELDASFLEGFKFVAETRELPLERREELIRFLVRLGELVREHREEADSEDVDNLHERAQMDRPLTMILSPRSLVSLMTPNFESALWKSSQALYPDNPQAVNQVVDDLVLSFYKLSLRPPRVRLLLRSVVTLTVGAYEALVTGLVSKYFRLHPRAMGDDQEFSLSDLKDSRASTRQLRFSSNVGWTTYCGKASTTCSVV
jgi:hypothetical protein